MNPDEHSEYKYFDVQNLPAEIGPPIKPFVRDLIVSLISVGGEQDDRKEFFYRRNVIGQALGHRRSSWQPFLWQRIGHWNAQAFVWLGQVGEWHNTLVISKFHFTQVFRHYPNFERPY